MIHTQPYVLVVDDDESIRTALRDYLQDWGFRVRSAADSGEMDRVLKDGTPDALVLDIMMPGEDGLSICRRMQQLVPVLMLSALGGTYDRVLGLELGAEDYLPKPFEPRELLVRLRKIIRRQSRSREARRLRIFDGWTLDEFAHEVRDPEGHRLTLTGGEFALLHAFASLPRRVLSRERLLQLIQGPLSDSYDRAIDLRVSRLRKKLCRRGCAHWIETVWGEGYKFTLVVEELNQ